MHRLIHARLLLAIAIATTIGAIEVGSLVASVPVERSANTAVVDYGPGTILPTIKVHAPDEIHVLPVVLVRPTSAQRAEVPVSALAASAPMDTSSQSVNAVLPHVRLDMPYYSFGKMLPNVIKD